MDEGNRNWGRGGDWEEAGGSREGDPTEGGCMGVWAGGSARWGDGDRPELSMSPGLAKGGCGLRASREAQVVDWAPLSHHFQW